MLKKIILLTTLVLFSTLSLASAADELHHLDIDSALQSADVQAALLPDIKLYFAGEKHPPVVKDFGVSRTSKRTNSFLKDKIESCDWALASALLNLQESAVRHGGNAVINITSNIDNRKNASSIQYDCLIGTMMVNVALVADIVKLGQ